MGWGSAVDIFDQVVDVCIELTDPDNEDLIMEIVRTVYTKVELYDWDTQGDSKYFNKYLIHVMYDMDEIEKDYYDEFVNYTDYN